MSVDLSWTKFYMEFADNLTKCKNNRKPLMDKIHEIHKDMGFGDMIDKFEDDTQGLKQDICPFTTMSEFNRNLTRENRIGVESRLAEFLDVGTTPPKTWPGIPVLPSMSRWFYWYHKDRKQDHIDKLWDVFVNSLEYADKKSNRSQFIESFDAVLERDTPIGYLTIGLFWIRPYEFLPLDSSTRNYLEEKYNVQDLKPTNCEEYLKIIEKIRTMKQISESTFPKLSDAAYVYLQNSSKFQFTERDFDSQIGKEKDSKYKFTPVDSWKFIDGRIYKLDSPSMEHINSIISNIQRGRYAIPTFQRKYTWTRKQVEELWESIFHGFFVGSILTWNYGDQVTTEPIEGGPSLQNPTDIILDGQQRITSLYNAVVKPDIIIDDKCIVFFVNLLALLDPRADTADIVFSENKEKAEKRGLLEKETQFAKKIFPLTLFNKRDYTLWLGEFKTYLKDVESLENADEYYDKIQEMLDYVWFQYQIPVVSLPQSLSLDSVAEIFEKINSKGTRLGIFDLLNARFTKYGINLRGLWENAIENSVEIKDMEENFEDAAAKFTLQGLCLFKKGYARRKELLTLDDKYKESGIFQKERFLKEWGDICNHVSAAITKLKSHREDGFGAVALWMTPYTVIVPILAALMYKVENRLDMPKCMDKIQNWYWSVVISDSYSGSTDTKIEKDYRELLQWFDNDESIPEIVKTQREEVDLLDLNTTKTNDSIYKAVICLVAKSGANDFVTNNTPEHSALDDHHIFPKSLASNYTSKISINSILNRTIINRNTNRKLLRNKKPVEYIKEIMEKQNIDESAMRKRLKPHLISDDAFDYLLNDDFEKFVQARAETIKDTLSKLLVR